MQRTPQEKIRRLLATLPSDDSRSGYDRPDYNKLERLTRGTTTQRAAVACRLLLDRQYDCRAFDNCFESGDGDEVVAYIIDKARQNCHMQAAVCRAWSSEPMINGLPACLMRTWEQQRNPLFAAA